MSKPGRICPLCGEENHCMMANGARSQGPCWCERVCIPPELIDRVPSDLRGKSCICSCCVEKFKDERGTRITIKAGEEGEVAGLHLRVEDITEKWLPPDRRAMMRITIAAFCEDQKDTLTLESDKPELQWNGYRIDYLGGWRSEAQLRITKLSE